MKITYNTQINMNNSGLFFAIGAAIIWGLVYTFDQRILTKISPLNLLFLGSLITAIITLPIVLSNWESIKPIISSNSRQILYLIIATQILGTLASFFIFSSIQKLGAPVASMFEIAYPFFVAIFTLILFGGSLNAYFWIGALFMFLGGVIIIRFT